MEVFMRKSVSRNLYLLALVFAIVAIVLIVLSASGSTVNTIQNGSYSIPTVTSIGNPGLFFAGIGLAVVGGIFSLIAWIGALVRTAQLGRWGWFVCLIVLSGITMLIYIFAGPTTPANQPVYTGQYPPQEYPRQ
jgi:hypothetical protein